MLLTTCAPSELRFAATIIAAAFLPSSSESARPIPEAPPITVDTLLSN